MSNSNFVSTDDMDRLMTEVTTADVPHEIVKAEQTIKIMQSIISLLKQEEKRRKLLGTVSYINIHNNSN